MDTIVSKRKGTVGQIVRLALQFSAINNKNYILKLTEELKVIVSPTDITMSVARRIVPEYRRVYHG